MAVGSPESWPDVGRWVLKAAERYGRVDLVVSIEAIRSSDPRRCNCSQSKFGCHCLIVVERMGIPRGGLKYMSPRSQASSTTHGNPQGVRRLPRPLALRAIKRCGESMTSPPVCVHLSGSVRHWSVVVEDRHVYQKFSAVCRAVDRPFGAMMHRDAMTLENNLNGSPECLAAGS